jgi:Domain of unknown function (DUF4411)
MQNDLFSKPAQYTIDSSSLMAMFGDESILSKNSTPGLWDRVLEFIKQGIIISHIEVLYEIKKDGKNGEELYDWAYANDSVFQDYDWEREGKIIRSMSPKYSAFVNAKVNNIHADPWLIAQAKSKQLKVISEEKMSYSPDIKKHKIPNVCLDSLFNVGCVDLWGLMKEQNWKLK